MASGGKRGSAGERVLEGRHVIGLFMLMLLFSGLFFTLGFVMGRNQYDGQVRAATNLRGITDTDVQPKEEVATKPVRKKSSSEPKTDTDTPSISENEFYHAVESSKPDDHLRPVANAAPVAAAGKPASSMRPSPTAPRTSPGAPLSANGGVDLQVTAVTKRADALALANSLRKKKFPAFVQTMQGDKYYHVLVGPYADQKAIDNARKGLELAGFKQAIVKR
ncbi:MAG: SPOR domain-containing protein [Candidatus Acidiferrum sp.]